MNESERKSKYVLLPLFLVVLLDLAGVGLVIPVIAPLLLDPSTNLLPPATNDANRIFVIGFLTSLFAIGQFFGAPILGALSDRHGRKSILIFALIGRSIGYLIFALGIAIHNLPLLFFSRFVSGFSAGDIAVAFSATADLSHPSEKAKNFGLLGMAFGIGFIIGPFLGGKLADPTVVSWFNNTTPFIFASIVTILNVNLVLFMLKETLRQKIHSKITPLSGFTNLRKAWAMTEMRIIFLVIFFLMFGFSFFMQFFQVFLVQKFDFRQSQIGDIYAFLGLSTALAQGLIVRPLSKHYSPQSILSYSALGLALALLLVLLPTKSQYLFLVLPLVATFQGLTNPNSIAVVSNLASEEIQGEILGIRQSIVSISMAIPPFIAGIIAGFNINFPLIVASFSVFISWLIFIFFFKNKRRT